MDRRRRTTSARIPAVLVLRFDANVRPPPPGAHVRVIGPHVYDSWVGWNEIHPAWRIEILAAKGQA